MGNQEQTTGWFMGREVTFGKLSRSTRVWPDGGDGEMKASIPQRSVARHDARPDTPCNLGDGVRWHATPQAGGGEAKRRPAMLGMN